jgi:hypothetical protein
MLKRSSITASLAVFGMVVFAGCGGGDKNTDPYAEVSLKQATRGPVVISKGFKYKLRSPKIVEMSGDLLLVQEGNIMELIAGRSIADKLQGKDLSNVEFNVVKMYSPYVHFKCEQIVSGQDTVFMSRSGGIAYPAIIPEAEFKAKEYDDYDLDRLKFNRTADLRKAVDKQFWVEGTLSRVEEDGEETWMLTGDRGSTVRIVDPTDGVTIALKMLLDRNERFEGGVTFTEVEPWTQRRDNHICGNVEVDFVKLMDKVIGS